MEEESQHGVELYSQHGVLVKSHAPCNKEVDFRHNVGTLSVVEYESSLGKCIEWRQCDVSIECVDQEWAIVQDVTDRSRTISESSNNWKPPVIQLELKNMISFRISKNNQQLTLVQRGGTTHSCFSFQQGNADRFVQYLKSFLKVSSCSKDPKLYLIMDQRDVQNLEKSFAELDLFTDNTRTDAVWGFMRKFHDSPYEATMDAFCKVTDALLHTPQHQRDDEMAEWLNRSLTADEVCDLNGRVSGEEYEVITRGPPLPPRIMPMRCPPLSQDQWNNFVDYEGRVPESDIVKEIVFHGGVSRDLRREVWKYLLDYFPWDMMYVEREAFRNKKVEEYYSMKLQWKSMSAGQEERFTGFKERKSLIEKDVYRTDRTMEFFAGDRNKNLEVLQDILMTYVMYNFDLGYVQGMSDLLSPLLVQLNDEVDTFWCFVGFMERVSRNFDEDQAGMKQQLQFLYTVLATAEPEFALYLDQHESSNMTYCFRWLLVWFKREFSYDDIFLLWEVLWTGSLCRNFHLLVCVAILSTEKDTLMSNNFEFTEILKHVNELANKMDVDMLLRKAEGIFHQLSSATRIPGAVREIIGLEPLPEPEEIAHDNLGAVSGSNEASEVPGVSATNTPTTNGHHNSSPPHTSKVAFERALNIMFL